VTAGFVRAARAADAVDLARVQVASWRVTFAGLVPEAVLGELTSPAAQQRWAERWREAITKSPSSRHRVHVAYSLDGDSGAADRDASGVTGFASAGPATDPDLWPGTDGELYELHVLPELADLGHDSRLLHAVADTLASDGFHTASTWALSADERRLDFLESAGWAPDGSHSNLDMGVKVHVIRLQTRLSAA
jgi:ribosomal protein S18 acetylase RimI-like enzyme